MLCECSASVVVVLRYCCVSVVVVLRECHLNVFSKPSPPPPIPSPALIVDKEWACVRGLLATVQ